MRRRQSTGRPRRVNHERLVALYRAGHTTAQVARKMRVTPYYATKLANRYAVRLPPPGPPNPVDRTRVRGMIRRGLSRAEIGRRLGYADKVISGVAMCLGLPPKQANARPKLTRRKELAIIRAAVRGESYGDVADRLGLHRSRVAQVARAAGVRRGFGWQPRRRKKRTS